MSTATRQVSWGEGLVVAAFKAPGGMNPAVNRIRAIAGPTIGVRNTFAKLLRVTDPTELDARDQFRAWLLLVALGEDPAEWSIGDDVVPAGFDVRRLRKELPRLDSNQQPAGYPRRPAPVSALAA